MKGEPTDPLHLTRLSQVTIEPFYKDNLNNANIPPELNEDETGLIKRKIDLPIMLLRCKDKPGAVWTLRLPEFNFLGSKEAEGYQEIVTIYYSIGSRFEPTLGVHAMAVRYRLEDLDN